MFARLWYVAFYGEFGLDPEDVGISYAATLARALPGFLIIAVPGAVVVYVFARTQRDRSERIGTGVALGITTLGFLIFVTIPDLARSQADEVKKGNELRATGHRLSRASFRNLLGLNVREIEVVWRDKHKRPVKLGSTLMLLGSAADVYYLYSKEHNRTVRLPRDLVIAYEPD